jgi:hypothetical protein
MKWFMCWVTMSLAVGAAQAAEWVAFGDEIHLDLHSVQTIERSAPVVSAWFKFTGEMGKYKDNPRTTESRTKVEVNCRTKLMRTHGHYRYDKKRDLTYQEHAASVWVDPPPESAGELMMGAACGAWVKLKAGGLLPD